MDPGGAKKFLYTGTKRQAEEEQQWSFAPKSQDSNNKSRGGMPVDLNDVWSIQKNVSLGGTGLRGPDRLTHNASKGFYSRHGGMKDGSNKPSDKSDGGNTWNPARVSSFSYSYTGNTGADDSSSIASSHVSRGYHSNPSPRRFDRQGGPVDENDF
ncbi:uncharacterized protein LOC143282757 isoform X2 [Babylonia areolata]|uniref:uncharacterized protein LOC143282757 isoform X2 n=1 Tax=Babylonia areolata TaxID=304850 RepID=UPI003FD02AC7